MGEYGKSAKPKVKNRYDLKKINLYFPDGLMPDPDNPTTPEEKDFINSLSPKQMKGYREIYESFKNMQKSERFLCRSSDKLSKKPQNYGVQTVFTNPDDWERDDDIKSC